MESNTKSHIHSIDCDHTLLKISFELINKSFNKQKKQQTFCQQPCDTIVYTPKVSIHSSS